ncbi:hypothetical protein [Mastigocoleus testarum]|uniref:hypothetical protein n=1 Tax=Mastigocoleus testarum TaxID=996925 RepID=UPI000AFBE7C9|nr:hypothetical protein [Mastigocoleus testarum]
MTSNESIFKGWESLAFNSGDRANIRRMKIRIQESGVRSQESGVRSQESGVRSQE